MHEPEDDTPHGDAERARAERARAERGAALIAAAMAHPEAHAPPALREALATARPVLATRRLRRRTRITAAGALAVAGVLSLVVALSGEDGNRSAAGPTVAQIAGLGRLPATAPPPSRVADPLPRLAVVVEGLAFPDWRDRYGWEASGRRDDRLADRAVTTVFYRGRTGARLGYSIVAGRPIAAPSGGTVVQRGGVKYRVNRVGGRTIVSWTQGGHTCVLDGPSSVPAGQVLRLAAWAAV